jgi:hypothetical protein
VAPDSKTRIWIGRLLPVPIEWAPFFLGYPDVGMAFRRVLKLVASVKKAEQEKFWGFALSIMFACCFDANQKKGGQWVIYALETPAVHQIEFSLGGKCVAGGGQPCLAHHVAPQSTGRHDTQGQVCQLFLELAASRNYFIKIFISSILCTS